jgi:hypothetical protein
LLYHQHSCQCVCLNCMTSHRPMEHKSWKGPWKTFPSKHLRYGHASLPRLTGLAVSEQKQGLVDSLRAHCQKRSVF